MTLKQLRYVLEVARCGLNVSSAAESLFTSQSGISKQIRLLESELGIEIFVRNGKHLSNVSPAGEQILLEATEIIRRVGSIRSIAAEFGDDQRGELSIATTHTQSRYVLPKVIQRFTAQYPGVRLHLHQGSPTQIAQLAAVGDVDFAIATEGLELFSDLVMMPCYRWNRVCLLPLAHPLSDVEHLSLTDIAEHPIVTYTFGFTGRSRLDEAFSAVGLSPRVTITAADADVIKTYVRLGHGVGIVAGMAVDPNMDGDLIAKDVSHLFRDSVTSLGFRRGTYLRRYMLEFMKLFAPHLTEDRVAKAVACKRTEEIDACFADVSLPLQEQLTAA